MGLFSPDDIKKELERISRDKNRIMSVYAMNEGIQHQLKEISDKVNSGQVVLSPELLKKLERLIKKYDEDINAAANLAAGINESLKFARR